MWLFRFFADNCTPSDFFGLPPWYKYLVSAGRMAANAATNACEMVNGFQWDKGDIVLIALGVLDILLRLSGLVAVGFVIWGGIQYIISDGQPDKTKEAQQTIINALVGLVIAIIATASVSFIGAAVSKSVAG